MNLDILVTPIICGIVGYATNVIAIKMLFQPRYEKKVFGKRLPFTPGLLPKSKGKVAAAIGETVGDYLLTEESIKDSLSNSGFSENVENIIDDFLAKASNTEESLKDYYHQFFESDDALSNFKLNIKEKVFLYINENEEQIIKNLYAEVINYSKTIDANELAMNTLNHSADKIKELGITFTKTEGFDEIISKVYDYMENAIEDTEKPLNEIIPLNYIEKIEAKTLEFMPNIGEFIKNILINNEEINNQLKNIVHAIAVDNMGGLIGNLVYRRIYTGIKESIINYIGNDDNLKDIHQILMEKMNHLLIKNPSQIMAYLPKNDDFKEKAMEFIKSKTEEENINHIVDYVSNGIQEKINFENESLYSLITKHFPNGENDILSYINRTYRNHIKPKLTHFVDNLIDENLNKILNLKINQIMDKIGEENIGNIRSFILKNKDTVINKLIEFGSKKLDVKKTVEEKVNEFSVETLEELVLGVAKKELNYIAYMGGVLGFIFGFVPLMFDFVKGLF